MSHVHRLRITDRIFFVTVNLRRAVTPLSEAEYEPVAGFSIFGVCADAGPLARLDRAGLSPHHLPRDAGYQMDFGPLSELPAGDFGAGLATPVLGPLRAPR